MPNCANCNNLLPRTVDRCPVCGAETAWQSAAGAEPAAPSPAWISTPGGSPRAVEEPAMSPDDFLAEFLGSDGLPAAPTEQPTAPAPAEALVDPQPETPPAWTPAQAPPWAPVADVEIPASAFPEPVPEPAPVWTAPEPDLAPPAYQRAAAWVAATPPPEPAPAAPARAWDQPLPQPTPALDPFAQPAPEARAWDTPSTEPAPDFGSTAPRAWDQPEPLAEPTPEPRAWDAPAPTTTEAAPALRAWDQPESLAEPTPEPRAWDAPAPPTTEAAPELRAWDAPAPTASSEGPIDQAFASSSFGTIEDAHTDFATTGLDGVAPDPVAPFEDAEPVAVAPAADTPIFDASTLDAAGFGAPTPPAEPAPLPTPTVPAALDGGAGRTPPPDPTWPTHPDHPDSLVPRSVVATSSRIEGNFKRGPSSHHAIAIGVSAAASVAAAVLGWSLGWAGTGATYEQIGQPEQATEVIAEDPLAATDDTADTTETTVAEAIVSDAAIDGIVSLRLDDCGRTGTTVGVLVDSNIVLALRSEVLLDATPTIVLTDGTRIRGEVLNWSRSDDLAVIQTAEPIAGAIEWGTTGNIRTDSILSGLTGPSGVAPVWSELVVTDYDRSTGLVLTFEFDDTTLVAGAPVRKPDGQLAGLTDRSGTAARSAQLLRPSMVDLMTNPTYPASECPAPPPTEVPAEGAEGEEPAEG